MTNRPVNLKQVGLIRGICVGLGVALVLACPAQAAEPEARINAIVLSVTHRPGPQGKWTHSRVGSRLPGGSRVRTGRRSRCEIKFPDGSTVRMGPRSDLVIKTIKDKNLNLEKGRLFARIISGTVARITGASATAAIKGTWVEYIREAPEKQLPDTLRTWDGATELFNDLGSTLVTDGTESSTAPGEAPGDKTCTPPRLFSGGAAYPWWMDVKPGANISATPGTPVGQQQQDQNVTTLSVVSTAQAFTKGELDVIVQQARARRPAGYADSSVLHLVQAVGGIAMAATQQPEVLGCRYFGPYSQVDAYGLIGEGRSLAGARLRLSGLVKDTYGRVSVLASMDSEDDTDVELDETFVMRRTETDDFILGRQRLLLGPVNNNELGRLVGFGLLDGVRWHHKFDHFTEADVVWIDDFEPLHEYQASGWFVRIQRLVGGGQVGINWLDQRGTGSGVTCDFAWPAIPGKLDVYGEFGDDPYGAHLDTVGIYLPGLYQRSGLDIFVERARRSGYPSTTTVLAYQEFENDLSGVGLVRKVTGEDIEFGLGLIKRFGQLGD